MKKVKLSELPQSTDTASVSVLGVSSANESVRVPLSTLASKQDLKPIADWQSKIKAPDRHLLVSGCSAHYNWTTVQLRHSRIDSNTGYDSQELTTLTAAVPYTKNPDGTTEGRAGIMSCDQASALRDVVNDVTKLKADMPKKAPAAAYALKTDLDPLASKAELSEAEVAVFKKLWLSAVRTYGGFNPNNPAAPYQLYGLDLSLQEAINVYQCGSPRNESMQYNNDLIRTHLPRNNYATNISMNWSFFYATKIEVVNIGYTLISDNFFIGCARLRTINTIRGSLFINRNLYNNAFTGCVKLEYIGATIDGNYPIDVKDSPLLTLKNFQDWISTATNKQPITITVHPEVYAKLTDTDNTEWHKVLTDAAAKQITFATV